MKDVVYFDLETRKAAAEVGGWHNKAAMGISVAVTYSTRNGSYQIFTEKETDALIAQLNRADLVVGYNHIGFDYGVLQGFTILDLAETTINLDMCSDLEARIGHRIKLDSVAQASLNLGKTAEGIQALRWWAEYEKTGDSEKLLEIARYCAFDVKVTKAVHEFGLENGFIKYGSKHTGEIEKIPVDWKI